MSNNIILNKAQSKLLAVTYNKKPVKQIVFDCKKPATAKEVRQVAQKYTDAMNKKGVEGYVIVACRYGAFWRSGKMTEIGANVQTYDPNTSTAYNDIHSHADFNENVSTFIIYIIGMAKEGGADAHNDCLFNCLKQAYGGALDKMPKAVNRPHKFKQVLGLERDAPVSIALMPQVEQALGNASVNVVGDYTYISPVKPLNVKLRLKHGHYTLVNNEGRQHTAGAFFKPVDKENVYTYKLGTPIQIYDGEAIMAVAPEELKQYTKSFEYICISCSQNEDLAKARQDFISNADDLLEKTKGKINLYKYRNVKAASLDVWRFMSKAVTEPEIIQDDEAEIIDRAFMGGLAFAETYEGLGVLYDINSMYPSMMIDPKLMISTKAGTASVMTDDEFSKNRDRNYFKYGIYRCEIEGNHKLFKPNLCNHYTHFDLTCAHELGLEIKLIQDSQFNFYGYDKNGLVQAPKMFYEFVTYMYDLKQKTKGAKIILNTLWGALCEKKKADKVIKLDTPYDITSRKRLVSILPVDLETIVIKTEQEENRYYTDYARLGPFLTSYARLKMMRLCKPYTDDVVRIHTDSILLKSKVNVSFEVSPKLGHFKKEYEGHVSVTHVNKKPYNNPE